MFYIYILYSPSADKFYVGHTENYLQRLKEHNNSERITYTSKHRPWELKAVFECGNDRGEAQKIEVFIKKQKSRKLIEGIIHGQLLSGILAQLVLPNHKFSGRTCGINQRGRPENEVIRDPAGGATSKAGK